MLERFKRSVFNYFASGKDDFTFAIKMFFVIGMRSSLFVINFGKWDS